MKYWMSWVAVIAIGVWFAVLVVGDRFTSAERPSSECAPIVFEQ